MALIRPLFPDGTHIKTNDLVALTTYVETIGEVLGNLVKPGIINGLTISGPTYAQYQANPTASITFSAGWAILDSGKLAQFDSNDLSISAVDFYTAADPTNISATYSMYIVKTSELPVAQRPNIVGQVQTAQSKDVFSVILILSSAPPPTTSAKFLYGTIGSKLTTTWNAPQTLSVTSVQPAHLVPNDPPINFVQSYNRSLDALKHTAQVDSTIQKYTGPQIHGTDSIQRGTIAGTAMAQHTIDALRLNINTQDDTIKEENISRDFSLCPVGTIFPIAIGFKDVATMNAWHLSHPGWFVCAGQYVGSNQYPELYQLFLNSIDGSTLPFGVLAGSSNPVIFRLPDLRGYFIRMLDKQYPLATASGRDPNGATRVVGSIQDYSLKDHQHLTWGEQMGQSWPWFKEGNLVYPGSHGGGDQDNPLFRTSPVLTNGAFPVPGFATLNPIQQAIDAINVGVEVRPKNMALNYVIFCGKPALTYKV